MTRRLKILLLAGTREARELAAALMQHDVTASLAGVTSCPRTLGIRTRHGGFGGVDGLTRYLWENRPDLVLDATHPFAANIKRNADAACRATTTPLLHVLRPAWAVAEGDDWRPVATLAEAAGLLPPGARVFLATGSQSLEQFVARDDVWFLARVIDGAGKIPLANCKVIAAHPPFSPDHEVELLRAHRITHLVARNSGGDEGRAKLTAANRLGVPVVIVSRPPPPAGEIVASVAVALTRIGQIAQQGQP